MTTEEKRKVIAIEILLRAKPEMKKYQDKLKKMTDIQIDLEFRSLLGL